MGDAAQVTLPLSLKKKKAKAQQQSFTYSSFAYPPLTSKVAGKVNAVDLPNLWILYLQIHLLTKICLQPQNRYLQYIHNHSRTSAEKFELPKHELPTEV